MEAKHTPGPWFVDLDIRPGMEWNNHIVARDGDLRICFMAHGGEYEDKQAEAEANARLIAAAPELLAALELLVKDVGDYEAWQRPCHALDVAREAITKAKGEGL